MFTEFDKANALKLLNELFNLVIIGNDIYNVDEIIKKVNELEILIKEA